DRHGGERGDRAPAELARHPDLVEIVETVVPSSREFLRLPVPVADVGPAVVKIGSQLLDGRGRAVGVDVEQVDIVGTRVLLSRRGRLDLVDADPYACGGVRDRPGRLADAGGRVEVADQVHAGRAERVDHGRPARPTAAVDSEVAAKGMLMVSLAQRSREQI